MPENRWYFRGFELDVKTGDLRRNGEPVALEPMAQAVLMYLVRHRDRTVTREELIGEVWEGRAVVEEVLTRVIGLLRKALGDDRQRQAVIQTQHRRGYRFVAELRTAPAPARRTPADTLPYVGREKVFARLEGALDDVLGDCGRVVLLAGEPGIGKTRTLEEFASSVHARGIRLLTGWCYEPEGEPPLWPWMCILRALIADLDAEALQVRLGTSAPQVAQIVPSLAEHLPDLSEPPAVPPEEARFRLFDGVTQFLKRTAAEEPLVLFLEDLHWSEPATLLLLEFLAREVKDSRILVVGTYREQEVKEDHRLADTLAELARLGQGEQILLEGLEPDEVRQLLGVLVGSEPPLALVEAVLSRTEGNPFFIAELSHLLEAQPGVSSSPSGWQTGLPRKVKDVIQARLSRLSEGCQRVVAMAALVGREFDLEVLRGVWEDESRPLVECLEEAIGAGIVAELPGPAGRCAFTHDLLREVAYGRLSALRRVHLHNKVAETLEVLHGRDPERHLPELAYHFCEATSGGGDVLKAIRYSTEAAGRAARMAAWEEIMLQVSRARPLFALAPGSDDLSRRELALLMLQFRALFTTRGYAAPGALPILERAIELSEQLDDVETQTAALTGVVWYQASCAEYGSASAAAERVRSLCAQSGNFPVQGVAFLNLGMVSMCTGDLIGAREYFERSISLVDRSSRGPLSVILGQDMEITCRSQRSIVLAILGFMDQAIDESRASVELAERLEDAHSLGIALNWASAVRQLTANPSEGRQLAERLFQLASQRGDSVLRATGRFLAGWGHVAEEEVDLGVAEVEAGLAEFQGSNMRFVLSYFLHVLANVYIGAGRFSEALATVEGGLGLARGKNERVCEAELLRLRGELLLRDSRCAQQGEESLRDAIKVAKSQGAKLFELRAATSLARVWKAKRGKPEARRLLSSTYDWFTEGFDTPDLLDARALLEALS